MEANSIRRAHVHRISYLEDTSKNTLRPAEFLRAQYATLKVEIGRDVGKTANLLDLPECDRPPEDIESGIELSGIDRFQLRGRNRRDQPAKAVILAFASHPVGICDFRSQSEKRRIFIGDFVS